MGNFEEEIGNQNNLIKNTYSLDKKTDHKKEFDIFRNLYQGRSCVRF